MSEQSLPAWVRELVTLLPACAHFFLSGNVRDLYFAATDPNASDSKNANRAIQPLGKLLANAVQSQGIDVVVEYDISLGTTVVHDRYETTEQAEERAKNALNRDKKVIADLLPPRDSLTGLAQLIDRVSTSSEPVALIINSASRLVRDISHLADPEFEFYRRVDRISRDSRPRSVPNSKRSIYNPVIWVLDNERDVPSWFALRNEFVRSIVLPLPHTGERGLLADRLVPTLDNGQSKGEQIKAGVRTLTEQMAGMTLVAMERAVAIARDQEFGPDRIEDAARSYRIGVTDNPWRAEHLTKKLRNELVALNSPSTDKPPSELASRVLGQEIAVRKTLDILVRSATGLTAAQAGPAATRPRGVLFFAGPTGVGKTELAKALTKLIFEDERFYIRFDMSEFSAEHAADRLIGAPPGYVGYDAGGELTNAIRQRPFSLVLFDEIDKAHPRILDKFLQLLDDGRLTDGRGETVFFTESVIVFTSNRGIYEEIQVPNELGVPVSRLRKIPGLENMGYKDLAAKIQNEIRDYFTLQLGRPELLNRIGDNIVVFGFIDKPTGARILDLMLGHIFARVRQEHNIEIVIPPKTLEVLREACLSEDALSFGGRGIGNMLETTVINPLANQLFTKMPDRGTKVLLHVQLKDYQWIATLQPT